MSKDTAYYRLAFKIFADFTCAIAAPAVLAAVFGKWLDTKYQTSPRFLIVFFLLAVSTTAVLIVKKAKRYRDEFDSI